MNGITYYRLKSDYPGDYTKNCALNGSEVDNNFYVLEGRDVKSIAVNGKDIVVTLLNGDTVTATDALDFVKPEYALLSYGKNNRYGHPSEEVINRLSERKIGIISTCENGAVRIDEKGISRFS